MNLISFFTILKHYLGIYQCNTYNLVNQDVFYHYQFPFDFYIFVENFISFCLKSGPFLNLSHAFVHYFVR